MAIPEIPKYETNPGGFHRRYEVKDLTKEEQDPNAVYIVLRVDKADKWGDLCRDAVMSLASHAMRMPDFGWTMQLASYLFAVYREVHRIPPKIDLDGRALPRIEAAVPKAGSEQDKGPSNTGIQRRPADAPVPKAPAPVKPELISGAPNLATPQPQEFTSEGAPDPQPVRRRRKAPPSKNKG